MYRFLFDTLITRTEPESAHHVAMGALAAAGTVEPARRLIAHTMGSAPAHPVIDDRLLVFPRPFPARLGLGAGLDKNATSVLGLAALGFGFIEVGTVTRHPQPGNEPPRLWRYPEQRALRNRMGFNNDGADAVADRLVHLRSTTAGRSVVLGVNIGKSKITPAAQADADYGYSARRLARYADYLVINVSSPNTPGLRDLQTKEALAPIVSAVRSGAREGAGRDVPLLVKIAPDLSHEHITHLCAFARSEGLTGVVATNTTIAHDLGDGGLSGMPLRERALEVVTQVRAELGSKPVLIGCGGVSSAADAHALVRAGADLVQAYTAFIYEGPTWPGRVNRELTALLDNDADAT
ncbi:MAG: quinone-dependent dihydroorotate dehydrogenase [Bowdeniella nasicola]|nr:quinone-dependent dihydroorotate dehydrogenase [Bowdeniella nasicola]